MAQVTVRKAVQVATPSEEVLAQAAIEIDVTDALGRTITVRKPTMNTRRRTMKAISPETLAKDRLVGLYMLAATVVAIDGERVNLPATELQFDALVDRLDDAGMEAIGLAIQEHFGIGQSSEEVVAAAGE